jgi:hypothetical protein
MNKRDVSSDQQLPGQNGGPFCDNQNARLWRTSVQQLTDGQRQPIFSDFVPDAEARRTAKGGMDHRREEAVVIAALVRS